MCDHVFFTFFLLLKSDLLASKGNFNNAHKQLTRDCSTLSADRSMTITVRGSRASQCHKRELLVTLPALHPHHLCPVSALRARCQRSVPGVSALCPVSALRARCQRSVPGVSVMCPVSALCARCQHSGVSTLCPVSALCARCQRSVPGVSTLVSALRARCQRSVPGVSTLWRVPEIGWSVSQPFPRQLNDMFDRKLQLADSIIGAATSISFVAANVLSRQKYACRGKCFVATKVCLSRQNVCHDKHFC